MPHGMKMDSSSFLDLGEHEHMQDNQSHNQHQHQHQHQHQGYHPGEEIPSPVLQPQHGHGHGGSGVGVGVGAGARAGPSSGVGVGNGGASGSGVGVGAMTHASAHEHDLVHGHSHVRQSQGQAQNDLSQGHGHQDYHAHSHPQSQLTRTPSAPSHTLARAHSPPKSSIPIPPELHLLASTSAPPLVGVPSFDISEFASETISDRGEMGGKRKKQPHERAGWKEMDEQGLLKKRNVGGRKKSTIDEFVGFMPMEGDSQGQGQGGGMQEAQGQQQQQGQVQGQGQAQGQGQMGEGEGYVGMEDAMGDDKRISKYVYLSRRGPSIGGGKRAVWRAECGECGCGPDRAAGVSGMESTPRILGDARSSYGQPSQASASLAPRPLSISHMVIDQTLTSRTEQNRRAQQIYRRRREERMKQLEADAQALDKTRRALEENNVATQILAFVRFSSSTTPS